MWSNSRRGDWETNSDATVDDELDRVCDVDAVRT